MNHRLDSVNVCADIDRYEAPLSMGVLRHQSARGHEIFSFEYDDAWLARPEAFGFDPDLVLHRGQQYPPGDHKTFGIFLDSAPDRWGRLLMQRRENLHARREQRRPRRLTEWDYLLGVNDESRVGSLRFRFAQADPFVADDPLAAPPISSLRELQTASLQFERHLDDEDHPEYERWLGLLFAPGTSLGGARPKATVRDETGALCIAKFPSRHDEHDVGAWEIVAHRLAQKAGIVVPATRPLRLSGSSHTTFLAKRFDRTTTGRRLALVSAMTLTQHLDGDTGVSYLELVDLLQSRGADTRHDCAELFRRVVFNILIHNGDDHLRNHAFFIGEHGVRLSPVFDVNPQIGQDNLTLAINEVETACDAQVALECCRDYGLSETEARAIHRRIVQAVTSWRIEAARLGIPKSEQALMAAAFES